MSKMYYTEDEAAGLLNCTPAELTQKVRDKELRLFQDGDRKMFMASEVDALASPPAEEEEVELAPVTPNAPTRDDSATLSTGHDTGEVISADGISIFDDDDLEIESADPMAKTQIAPGLQDQIGLDGIGSGSGLLDLTHESDDTSLGEVIDGIVPDADDSGAPAAAPPEAFGGVYGDEAAMPAMPAEAAIVVEAEVADKIDGASGLFSGFVIGCTMVGVLIGILALVSPLGVVPDYVEAMKKNILAVTGGVAGLIIVCGVIGMLIGKSIATRQEALERMHAQQMSG